MKSTFATLVFPIGMLTVVACGARSTLDPSDDQAISSSGDTGGSQFSTGGSPPNTGGWTNTGGLVSTGGYITINVGGSGGVAMTGTRGGSPGGAGGMMGGGRGGSTGGNGGSFLAGGSAGAGGAIGSGGSTVGRGGAGGNAGGSAGIFRLDGGLGGSAGVSGKDGGFDSRDLGSDRGDTLATGGTPATGGSGGAGTTGTTCAGLASNEELIDNLDDGDWYIPKLNGRVGAWADRNDGTPGGSMYPDPANAFTPTDTGDSCRKYAVYVKGTGFTDSGASFSFGLGSPYNASKYTGISFWASSDGEQRLRVAFPDKDTALEGGTCKPTGPASTLCYDHYGIRIKLSPGWTKYTIKFSDLSQDGWGMPGSNFDPASLYEVLFLIDKNATFAIWVDDVAFTM